MTDLSQLEAALQSPEAVRDSLTAATFASLAARLEHAVAQGTADELKELERKLTSLLNDRWSALPAEVSGDILDSKRGVIGAAFEAGRLSFAHLFVSQASVHRAPDRFVGQVRKRAFVRYVEALRSGPKTNLELIDLVVEADATVSRKLRLLRAAGITGFRKEGRNVLNFLTPAAMAAAGGILSALPDPARATHEADQVVWRYNTLPIRNLSIPASIGPTMASSWTRNRRSRSGAYAAGVSPIGTYRGPWEMTGACLSIVLAGNGSESNVKTGPDTRPQSPSLLMPGCVWSSV